MPLDVDVVDSTWVGVRPAVLAGALAEQGQWRRWWPSLELEVSEWRGSKGLRWRVVSGHRGRVAGTMEVWLEPVDDGTVAHYFLRLSGIGSRLRARRRRRMTHSYRTAAKHAFWELSGQLDPGRLARLAPPVARPGALEAGR